MTWPLSPHKVIHLVDQTAKNAPTTMSQDVEEKFAPTPAKPEAPVDSMLKDMATIILGTFLLIGWVAFIITYPLVNKARPLPSPMLLSICACHLTFRRQDKNHKWANTFLFTFQSQYLLIFRTIVIMKGTLASQERTVLHPHLTV